MKRGYFVVVHDSDSVGICFIPEFPESIQLFKDFNSDPYMEYEKIQDLWNDYCEYFDYKTECWVSGPWIFNNYYIIESFSVYQY